MSYMEIIQNNCEHRSRIKWWPRFAYHYTDVENAVGILDSGVIFSRTEACNSGIMKNDNASRQVIDMTKTEALSCARFYFRPLTPTQYYNEGYKHFRLRYSNDENANTPVPVFFVFNLEQMLSLPGIKFSEQKQSGYGSGLLSGEDAFSKLNFDYIYSSLPSDITETKSFRHAEILSPDYFEINSCLNSVLCRNTVEKTTLMNLLKYKNPKEFRRYSDKIKLCREDMFEENGLYISECRYYKGNINIIFSEPYLRKKYTIRMKEKNGAAVLEPVRVRIELDWYNMRTHFLHKEISTLIDYERQTDINITSVPQVKQAKKLSLKVYFEKNLMCFMEFPLSESEFLK